MQRCLFLLFTLLFFSNSYSQSTLNHPFGQPTEAELELKNYDRDPDAPAVVLYEKGRYSVDVADNYIRLIKKVHRKIKVFDAQYFTNYTFEIPYFQERNVQENIKNLTAITHNGKIKKYVAESAIFNTDENPNYSLLKFTFPDVQDGSILEYSYQIETPYFSNIGDWYFAHEIPTIYSELQTELPGNYTFNRSLYGSRELDVNHAEIKKSCFHLPGFKVPGDCESATYIMKHIPAVKKEPYMLSIDNYRPALHFELAEMVHLNGSRTTFSKDWKNVEKVLKSNFNFERELKRDKYFKSQLPPEILAISDPLERAKAVYYFIQNHYNWNGKYRIFSDVQTREAFESKTGNISQINLSLVNALEAAGIESEIMLITSAEHPIVTKQHPTLFGFNYAIVLASVNGQKYQLDASDKFTSFGVLPTRALNKEGRVFSLKKGSRWEPIESFKNNMHFINLQLTANENGNFEGNVNEISTGHISYLKRKTNKNQALNQILSKKQSENEHINISDYSLENQTNNEQPYKESYSFTLDSFSEADRLFLYPFLIKPYFTENPFNTTSRAFPIDFGFSVINNYLISIQLNNRYEVIKVPENKRIVFPDNDAELSVMYDVVGSGINIRLNLKLNETSYPSEALPSLNQLFTTLIEMQKNQPIELKKI